MSDNIKVCIVGVGGSGRTARMLSEALAKAEVGVEIITTEETLTKAEKTFELIRHPNFEKCFIETEPVPGTKRWRRENKKRY